MRKGFFHTGDGDTILVRGGDEWGLIDANFDSAGVVRGRVREALGNVTRLRFVCITHLDKEHIRGMRDFLTEEFSDVDRRGRRTWRIDQVIVPLSKTSLDVIDVPVREDGQPGEPPLIEGDVSHEAQKLLRMLCEMMVRMRR
jgi:glyoxylase-like metal-dependent hydrolase (beta-lactamase superfamily II)